MGELFIAKKMNPDLIGANIEHEYYAYVHSTSFKKATGCKAGIGDESQFEGLIEISNGCKKAYRKCVSSRTVDNGKEIHLGYRTLNKLGIDIKNDQDTEVDVRPAKWYCYLWNHESASIRGSFKVAVIFGCISIALSIASIIVGLI